jgi:hypothetical protein
LSFSATPSSIVMLLSPTTFAHSTWASHDLGTVNIF